MTRFARIERKSRRWEQVWQGESEAVASIVGGRLEAEGIRVQIQGHTTPYRTAALNLGGAWAILVPAGKAAHARAVLRDNEEGHNLIEDEVGGGLSSNQRATIQFMVLLGLVIALFVGVVALVN